MFRTSNGTNHLLTFALVCCLFLLWGLCNGMIDVLNKHFQNSLGVTKTQSAFVQGAWYAAYFLMAFPSGWVAKKFGYRGGILSGLGIVLVGSLLFVPVTRVVASEIVVFGCFLGALFIVGSGLTFLETVANPYATVLGPIDSAVSRINLAQSCNAVGWILGPIIGSQFILSVAHRTNRGGFERDNLWESGVLFRDRNVVSRFVNGGRFQKKADSARVFTTFGGASGFVTG